MASPAPIVYKVPPPVFIGSGLILFGCHCGAQAPGELLLTLVCSVRRPVPVALLRSRGLSETLMGVLGMWQQSPACWGAHICLGVQEQELLPGTREPEWALGGRAPAQRPTAPLTSTSDPGPGSTWRLGLFLWEGREGSDQLSPAPPVQAVVLMDPSEDPEDTLHAHRSRECTFIFDRVFDQHSTQVPTCPPSPARSPHLLPGHSKDKEGMS